MEIIRVNGVARIIVDAGYINDFNGDGWWEHEAELSHQQAKTMLHLEPSDDLLDGRTFINKGFLIISPAGAKTPLNIWAWRKENGWPMEHDSFVLRNLPAGSRVLHNQDGGFSVKVKMVRTK